jgi:hypothetical protein
MADLGANVSAFGHPQQRRLGLRVPVHCWALLSCGSSSSYAFAVELSPTSVVLELIGRRSRFMCRPGRLLGLDLFVPGAASTVHVGVRRVRYMGQREAYELVQVSEVDRLTLAEYLDRMTRAASFDLAPWDEDRRGGARLKTATTAPPH